MCITHNVNKIEFKEHLRILFVLENSIRIYTKWASSVKRGDILTRSSSHNTYATKINVAKMQVSYKKNCLNGSDEKITEQLSG